MLGGYSHIPAMAFFVVVIRVFVSASAMAFSYLSEPYVTEATSMEHFEQWAALVRGNEEGLRRSAVLHFIDVFRSEWQSAWSVTSFPEDWWESAPEQCTVDVSLADQVVELLRDFQEGSEEEFLELCASCEKIAERVNSEALYLGRRAPLALVYIGLLTAVLRDVTKTPRPSEESPPDLDEFIEALPDACVDYPELLQHAALCGLGQG